MAREKERKFLVHVHLLPKTEGDFYRQGFLSLDPKAAVRVRVKGDNEEGLICVKGALAGIERPEFDYEIPPEDACEMLGMAKGHIIEKIRHRIEHEGHYWAVDEFLGVNAGLWLAEIELMSADEEFAKPVWLGREVTDDPRYYNVNLAQNPYCNWGPDAPKPGAPHV